MTSLKELENANRRLTILELLAGDDDGRTSARLLYQALPHVNTMHRPTLQQVREDLLWLEKRLLVQLTVAGEETFAQLTQRGKEVADGQDSVDGVDDPKRLP